MLLLLICQHWQLGMGVTEPSRVLRLFGVPRDAAETEIVQLGIPFGRVTNCMLGLKGNQAREQA